MSNNAHKKERGGEIASYHWAVIAYSHGHRCGYARVPPNHPWNGMDYAAVDYVEVHGGLTFSANYPDTIWDICEFPAGGTVFGFDCHHSGDKEDYDIMSEEYRIAKLGLVFRGIRVDFGEVRTADYVEGECRQLIFELDRAAVLEKNDD